MPFDAVLGPLAQLNAALNAFAGYAQAAPPEAFAGYAQAAPLEAFSGFSHGGSSGSLGSPEGAVAAGAAAFDATGLLRAAATLVLPPALPLLLVAIGLMLLGRLPRLGRTLAWTGVLAGILLSSALGAALVANLAEADTRAPSAGDLLRALASHEPPQAIVIIGGGARQAGRELPQTEFVKSNTLERLVHGAWVARLTGLPVLVSGGVPSAGRSSEAVLMKRTLQTSLATPVRWLEDASRDTAGNARLSARILHAAGVNRVILVTHAYHMPRARTSFERAGLQVLPAPHGFAGSASDANLRSLLPSGEAALTAYRASHELLGRLWYALRNR